MDAQEIRSVAMKLVETLNATAIPVGRDKKPGISEWQSLTQAECQRGEILDRYGSENPSIGIVVGKPSHNLCSIDLDSDELLDEFLHCNPRLQKTLISRGARGGNVWVRIRGRYPRLARIKRAKAACGEWRADGGYTILWGEHPTGIRYSCNHHLPVEIAFAKIQWPEGFEFKGKSGPIGRNAAAASPQADRPRQAPTGYSTATSAPLPVCTTTPLQHCTPAPLHDIGENRKTPTGDGEGSKSNPPAVTPQQILLHQQSIERATAQLARENPELAKLYGLFMERRYEARPHERNAVIVEAVPFLFRAVAEELISPLLAHFHHRHAPLFEASEAEHMKEVRAMIRGVRNRYLETLPPSEQSLYNILEPRIQTVYRICRDLAEIDESSNGRREFFMSADQMALRLNVDSRQAHRELHKLCGLGVMGVTKRGTRRSAGVRGEATTYGWLLSS